MKSYLIVLLILTLSSNLLSQNDESVVAQVGNDKITAREFKLRYELSPYIPSDKNIDPDSIKFDFIYSLVAEKLWAKDAEILGFSNTDKFRFLFKPLEDMFIRDALFKIEIDEKIILSANDINNGIIKSQSKLNTQVITAKDSVSIYNFYNQLKAKNNFDSLVSGNKNLKSNDFEIILGALKDEEIEDSIYALDINEYTDPIKSEVGWIIFRVKNKFLTPIDLSNKKTLDDLKKKIRERRIEKRYREFLKELLSGIIINITPDSFNKVNSIIWDQIKSKKTINDSLNYFELSEYDFNKINMSLGQINLNQKLFTISKREVSIESFLSSLAFSGFNVTKLDSTLVLQKLNQRVKRFVEEQLITEEAYERRLQFTPQFRRDLTIWRENYLAQLYFNNTLDSISISDNEVYNYYLNELVNANSIRLINVRLVSIKDLDEVSNIFDLLKQGKEFKDILNSYGKTDSLVDLNGETGLKPVLLLGYIGDVASKLNLNEVYGPIKRNDAYTIMQVFERQDSNDSLRLSFDSIKGQLRNDLRFKKLRERLNKITSNLAEQNNVKIFTEVVDKIQSSQIPMFIHRVMGFGGRIAGVPLTTPFSGWFSKEVKQKLLP